MRSKEKTTVELKIILNDGDCDSGKMIEYGICKMILRSGMSAKVGIYLEVVVRVKN